MDDVAQSERQWRLPPWAGRLMPLRLIFVLVRLWFSYKNRLRRRERRKKEPILTEPPQSDFSFERDGRPLSAWLLDLVSDDRATRDAAAQAVGGMWKGWDSSSMG